MRSILSRAGIFSSLALFLTLAPLSRAEAAGDFGAGILLGQPTGLSGKLWLNNERALDFGLAYSFGDSLTFLADHLWHFPAFVENVTKSNTAFTRQTQAYLGVGGVVHLGKKGRDAGVGIRVPLGLEWRNADRHVGIFGEIVPGILLAPETDALFEGGIGVRYYF